jgi:peroxiredoxin Q/BCP
MPSRVLLALGLIALSGAAACQKEQKPDAAAPSAPAPAEASELLAVGAPAPALKAEAQTGEVVDLAALRGRPVVVYFYPKDDTPGCTVEAQELRDLWSEIQTTSAVVIGVSTDDAGSHKQFAEKHALPFLLVPDTDHRFIQAFRVPLNANGRARRVTFLIDKSGKVAKVFPEVKPQGHGREVLDAIRALG